MRFFHASDDSKQLYKILDSFLKTVFVIQNLISIALKLEYIFHNNIIHLLLDFIQDYEHFLLK